MAGPDRRRYTDINIATISGVDTVGGIEWILQTHDRGYFVTSSQLCDAMRRDDRISGVCNTRVGALLAAPLEIKPANDSDEAARVAKILSGGDGQDGTGLWEQMFPSDVIKGLSSWGNELGFGLAEIIWTTTATEWVPRLKLWHPQFVYWDFSESRFMVVAAEGTIPLPRIDENPHGDGKWVVFTPHGYTYGWLHGLVRCLADKYMMRRWDYRDWARFNERHGQPVIGAQVPQGGDQKVREDFVRNLSTFGADAAIELPQIDGEEKYDLKMIESQGRNWESFKAFKSDLDTDIAVAVLGQNLTTEGGKEGGSRALGEVQNLVRIDKALEDARIADCLRLQCLTHWARANFGDEELAPRASYQVRPPEDELKEATAMKAYGDGLVAMKNAGAPIDVRTILTEAGYPLISEEEEAAQAAVKAEEDAAALEAARAGAGGAGGRGVDGKEPPAKKAPKDAALSSRIPLPGALKRYTFQGMGIAVENPAGSIRMWRDPGPDGGTVGTTTMLHDYGFIDGVVDSDGQMQGNVVGGDGEEIDCYIGPDENATDVHVVHQLAAPDFKRHDEDKVFLGFADPAAAKEAFLAHRNDAGAFGGMSTVPLSRFKAKLKRRTGTGKIRATAREDHDERRRETVDALLRLGHRAPAAVALARPHARARATKYADRVADQGKRLAARALAVDLVAIKEEIDACSSFEDLRRRIVVRFKDMDPKRLADVVAKTRIMAKLGGRLSAVRDI